MVNVVYVSEKVTIVQDPSLDGGPLFAVHTGCAPSYSAARFFYDGNEAWACGNCAYGYQPTRKLDIANYYTFKKADPAFSGQVRYSLQQWVASWLGIEDYRNVEIVLD